MSGSERESRVGTQFGPYLLVRLIGRGGMGEVYEAEDTVKDRTVALKLLPESMSSDPEFRTRLKREAHSAGRLQEPHVVPIHDYGEIDGVLFVDMRMIAGTDLRGVLKKDGPMKPARAVAIVRQIGAALDAAHQTGVMHRDVKPENILITGDDFAYLVDFGIASAATDEKLTQLGTAVGTYAYMAPERFVDGEVTARADVYALACVLYECLTGAQPYPADSVGVVITAHLQRPVPRASQARPGVPRALDEVVARGMAKEPGDRYPSAGELAMAAHKALTAQDQDQATSILRHGEAVVLPSQPHVPPPPPPMWSSMPSTPAAAVHSPYSPPGGPPGPSGGKNRSWIPIVAVVAALVIILGGVGIWFLTRSESSSSTQADSTTSKRTTTTTTTSSTTADEAEIRSALSGLENAFNRDDFYAFTTYLCEENANALSASDFHQIVANSGSGTTIDVGTIEVTGDTATAEVSETLNNGEDLGTSDWKFVRENGDWKYCP